MVGFTKAVDQMPVLGVGVSLSYKHPTRPYRDE